MTGEDKSDCNRLLLAIPALASCPTGSNWCFISSAPEAWASSWPQCWSHSGGASTYSSRLPWLAWLSSSVCGSFGNSALKYYSNPTMRTLSPRADDRLTQTAGYGARGTPTSSSSPWQPAILQTKQGVKYWIMRSTAAANPTQKRTRR
jgi:hypothetical protein